MATSLRRTTCLSGTSLYWVQRIRSLRGDTTMVGSSFQRNIPWSLPVSSCSLWASVSYRKLEFPGQNENLGLRLLNNSALTYTEVNYSGKYDKVNFVYTTTSIMGSSPTPIHVLYDLPMNGNLYIKGSVPVNEFSSSQCVLCRKDLIVTSIVILKATYVLYESDVLFFVLFFLGGGGITGMKFDVHGYQTWIPQGHFQSNICFSRISSMANVL